MYCYFPEETIYAVSFWTMVSTDYSLSIKINTAVSKKIVIYVLELVLGALIFHPRLFIFTKQKPTMDNLLNTEYE